MVQQLPGILFHSTELEIGVVFEDHRHNRVGAVLFQTQDLGPLLLPLFVLESIFLPRLSKRLDQLLKPRELVKHLESVMGHLQRPPGDFPFAVLVVKKKLEILGRVFGDVKGGETLRILHYHGVRTIYQGHQGLLVEGGEPEVLRHFPDPPHQRLHELLDQSGEPLKDAPHRPKIHLLQVGLPVLDGSFVGGGLPMDVENHLLDRQNKHPVQLGEVGGQLEKGCFSSGRRSKDEGWRPRPTKGRFGFRKGPIFEVHSFLHKKVEIALDFFELGKHRDVVAGVHGEPGPVLEAVPLQDSRAGDEGLHFLDVPVGHGDVESEEGGVDSLDHHVQGLVEGKIVGQVRPELLEGHVADIFDVQTPMEKAADVSKHELVLDFGDPHFGVGELVEAGLLGEEGAHGLGLVVVGAEEETQLADFGAGEEAHVDQNPVGRQGVGEHVVGQIKGHEGRALRVRAAEVAGVQHQLHCLAEFDQVLRFPLFGFLPQLPKSIFGSRGFPEEDEGGVDGFPLAEVVPGPSLEVIESADATCQVNLGLLPSLHQVVLGLLHPQQLQN